ncbi:replication protein [Arsenophonus nasoniae]|uniref:Replication protein n=1 Tax=Arsenophonus nasoniae TaxID=638 RepID=A0AA95GP60_9GAMM|nr:replication protein [Arsenophonus nasoniae]WGM00391.1 replication protein [Arsenophonus nasoniae]
MKHITPTETVNQIGRINLSGNVIPANWWHHIKMPSGKPDSTAIVLLSEIIYWYRPTEIRDESTGELKGWRKRFQGDKLQRSYQSFADQFGFTKREVTDALKRLKSQGIITLELRTINTSTGACCNVLFIEPVPARIDEITSVTQLVNNQPESESFSVTPPTAKRDTYTETTTEITTKNKNILIEPVRSEVEKTESEITKPNQNPIDLAFEGIFWPQVQRKVGKQSAKSSFKTQFRLWRKETGKTAEQFAEFLVADIRLRLQAKQFGFEKLHPATYLNGKRWLDDKPVIQSHQLKPQATTTSTFTVSNGLVFF